MGQSKFSIDDKSNTKSVYDVSVKYLSNNTKPTRLQTVWDFGPEGSDVLERDICSAEIMHDDFDPVKEVMMDEVSRATSLQNKFLKERKVIGMKMNLEDPKNEELILALRTKDTEAQKWEDNHGWTKGIEKKRKQNSEKKSKRGQLPRVAKKKKVQTFLESTIGKNHQIQHNF
jgi:hypothetical protein